MIEQGDAVVVCGKLKKVAEFVAGLDKESLRLLSSFFEGESKGSVDAKKLLKRVIVRKVYGTPELGTLEVELSKDYLWEDRQEYFMKVTEEQPEEKD